jgi:hypothetical protein
MDINAMVGPHGGAGMIGECQLSKKMVRFYNRANPRQ